MAVDNKGNAVVTGWFRTSTDNTGKQKKAAFGKLTIKESPTGSSKGFVQQRMILNGFLGNYDRNGTILWATAFGGSCPRPACSRCCLEIPE